MQNHLFRNSLIFVLAALQSTAMISARPVHAAAAGEFDYPELNVTPRASDRLEMEAGKEASRAWTEHLPIQISAANTLVAGFMNTGDNIKNQDRSYNVAGIVVGAGWLATTAVMAALYRPYTSASQNVNAMPRKTAREQLTRERFAEEALDSQASLATRLKWLSVLTNLGANAAMLSNAQSGSGAQIVAGVGAIMSFAPVIFRSYRQDVASEQREYKKKIYAPIAGPALFNDPGTRSFASGLQLSMSF